VAISQKQSSQIWLDTRYESGEKKKRNTLIFLATYWKLPLKSGDFEFFLFEIW
jgi:hypothetical protein